MNVHHFILISLNFYINIVKCEFVIESIGLDSFDERVFSTNLQPIKPYGHQAICDGKRNILSCYNNYSLLRYDL